MPSTTYITRSRVANTNTIMTIVRGDMERRLINQLTNGVKPQHIVTKLDYQI